jgi:outer membrane biosynthesis protein TonB
MALRFRRSKKILPGVRLNIGKSSFGFSIGPKGLKHTISTSGRRATTVGIPGSGLSYTTTHSKNKSKRVTDRENIKSNRVHDGGVTVKWYQKSWAAILFLVLFAPIGIFLMFKYQKWNVPVKAVLTVAACVVFIAALGSALNPAEPGTGDNRTGDVLTAENEADTDGPLEATEDEPEETTPEETVIEETASAPEETAEQEQSQDVSQVTSTEPLQEPVSEPAQPAAQEAIQEPAQEPTQEPTPEPAQATPALSIVSAPSTVHRNEDVTITVSGAPNTEYRLRVFYTKSESGSGSLGVKTSGADGQVSWTWQIGPGTDPGACYATISGGNENIRHNFTVEE